MCLRNTGLSTVATSPPNLTVLQRSCNGSLVLRVDKALLATVGATTIKVVVMARATPDMRFGVLKETNTFIAGVSARKEFNMSFQIQSGQRSVADVNVSSQSICIPEGDTQTAYPSGDVLWGEDILSVRALAQRFARVAIVGASSTSNTQNFVLPFYYPRPLDLYVGGTGPWAVGQLLQTATNGMGNAPVWTPFSHVASLFAGVRGSVRLKLMPNQIMNLSVRSLFDQDVSTATVAGQGSVDWFGNPTTITTSAVVNNGIGFYEAAGSGEHGVEVLLPNYAENKLWVYRYQGQLTDSSRQREILVQTVALQSTTTRCEISYAGGPDIAFIRFRRVPGVIAR